MDVKQFGNVVMPLIRVLFPKGCSNRGRFLLDESTFIGDSLRSWRKRLDFPSKLSAIHDLTLHARIPFIRAEYRVSSQTNMTEIRLTFQIMVHHDITENQFIVTWCDKLAKPGRSV